MSYDLCLHVDANDPAVLAFAFVNARNYMNGLPGKEFELVLVANGPAVKLFVPAQAELQKTAEELMKEFADSRLDKVQSAIDIVLDDLPEKLQKSNALQAATVLGILMDKFGGQKDFNGNAVQVNVTFGNKAGDMDAFK